MSSRQQLAIFVEARARAFAVGRRVVEGQRQMAKIVQRGAPAPSVSVRSVRSSRNCTASSGANTPSGTAAARPFQSGKRVVMSTCAPGRGKIRPALSAAPIVVEEEPGLFEAAIRDEFQRRARGFGAILHLLQARNEDRAQRHQPVHDARLSVGAKPPRARIALAVLDKRIG